VIATMADDIAALLDALEISSWVAIVGYAVGAAIAMHFAARRPQRSAALMAMSPATWVAPELRTAPWRASHGPNFADQFRRAAGYVDRILRGEKPADLPVEAPNKYELANNLKTAKALHWSDEQDADSCRS